MDLLAKEQGTILTHLKYEFPDKDLFELLEQFENLHIQETECNLCLEANTELAIEPCNCTFFKIHIKCLPLQLVRCGRCRCYYGGPLGAIKMTHVEPVVRLISQIRNRRRMITTPPQPPELNHRCRGHNLNGDRCSRTSYNGLCYQHRPLRSRQCRGRTRAGNQCTRKGNHNHYCYQHVPLQN